MTCNAKPMYNPFTGRLDFVGTGAGGGDAVKETSVLANAIASSVPATTKTTILTLSPSVDTFITNVTCSGHEYGKFFLVINTVDKMIKRGGSDRDVSFDFVNPLKIPSGSVFDVKVEHFVTGQTPDFEATVIGYT